MRSVRRKQIRPHLALMAFHCAQALAGFDSPEPHGAIQRGGQHVRSIRRDVSGEHRTVMALVRKGKKKEIFSFDVLFSSACFRSVFPLLSFHRFSFVFGSRFPFAFSWSAQFVRHRRRFWVVVFPSFFCFSSAVFFSFSK